MTPILYSFRRCPYAMRARLAIKASGVKVALREILLRDKAPAFLAVSPSGTVPCLVCETHVLDESYDIMQWAFSQNDPNGLANISDQAQALIKQFDGPFKDALDKTKYAVRHPQSDPEHTRATAMKMLADLDPLLKEGWLFGARQTMADLAILPFVRQFAMIDKQRFDDEASHNVSRWLERFLTSEQFAQVMHKYPIWREGDAPQIFGRE